MACCEGVSPHHIKLHSVYPKSILMLVSCVCRAVGGTFSVAVVPEAGDDVGASLATTANLRLLHLRLDLNRVRPSHSLPLQHTRSPLQTPQTPVAPLRRFTGQRTYSLQTVTLSPRIRRLAPTAHFTARRAPPSLAPSTTARSRLHTYDFTCVRRHLQAAQRTRYAQRTSL